MPELTPFPHGGGYMEHAWNGLTAAQRYWLTTEVGRMGMHGGTRKRLVACGLMTEDRKTTPRGVSLLRWVRENGL